jgi:CRP-like cAMP-binding protein
MSRNVETLSRVPLFRSLGPPAVKTVDRQCAWRRVAAGEWIIDHQDEGIDVFFVTAGSVRIMIYGESGREVILADLDAGGFFGELAAIDGKPRSAGVLAITNTVMAIMPGAVFMDIVRRHPEVATQVLTLLAARVRLLDQRVVEYSTLNVKERIWAELLRLSRPRPGDERQGVLTPPPKHAEIAARVSTRRETVARELKLLERQKLLQRRRGALVIADVPALMQRLDLDR